VICGADFEWTFSKMCIGSLYINKLGARLLVTNKDKFTVCNGRKLPAMGTVLECLLITLKSKRHELVGKPNPFALNNIIRDFGLEGKRICMVGDNPETDIMFGYNAGVNTC
jgi:ribonucleotide monophosphatase NagD (HAD superfamily)